VPSACLFRSALEYKRRENQFQLIWGLSLVEPVGEVDGVTLPADKTPVPEWDLDEGRGETVVNAQ
jgi:hypothetical protein